MSDPKRLQFTRHAQDVIVERSLNHSWIEKTVRSPEWSIPDPHRPGVEWRFHTISEFGGRTLRVVCIENAEEIRILTAFFDRDARKKL